MTLGWRKFRHHASTFFATLEKSWSDFQNIARSVEVLPD